MGVVVGDLGQVKSNQGSSPLHGSPCTAGGVSRSQDFFRQHMLSDTLLVPQLVLPYLDECVRQAQLLCDQ